MQLHHLVVGIVVLGLSGSPNLASAAAGFYCDLSVDYSLSCSGGTMYATIQVTNGGNASRGTRFSAHLPINDGGDATVTSVTCTYGTCLGLPSPATDYCRIVNGAPNNNLWYLTCGDWDITSGDNYNVNMSSSTRITVVVTITDAYDYDTTGYYKIDGNVYSSTPDYSPSDNYDSYQIVTSTPNCP